MSLIQALSEETISQISAGEVVERPSHLVKELIENALDAGAKEIEIDFDQGGRFVRVKDNGCGIPKNEMPLALARHATSKIQHTEDLWKLNTYGFRGEALASIASVSDFTLISGQKGKNSYKLRQIFGKESSKDPVGESEGTTVIIRSLFENTPARFKFLKSDGAENSSIKTTLKALALSQTQISFRVLQRGKLLFYWPAQKSLLERTTQILGEKELYWTEETKGAYKIQALIAPPHHTLKNKKSSWFFVSGRWIESRVIQAGLMSAYRGLLMHGEYPLAVIHLTGPSDEIDVNVHPAKSQVRFKNNSFIFKLVESPIRRLLEQAPWTKKISSSPFDDSEKNLSFSNSEFKKTHWPKKQQEYSTKTLSQLAWTENKLNIKKELEPQTYKINPEPKATTWSYLQILAQAHLTYIVCQSDKSLVFIDQHAAHERVIYERIFQSWKKGSMEVQNQLLPITLDLEEGQSSALLELSASLKKLGLQLESLGPHCLAVSSYPPIIKEKALQEGLLFLARQRLETGDSFSFERVVSDLCATLACHSAIRAGKSLNLEQMQELLKQMDEFPLSSFCPHGRPVFVEYPISRLEKDFGRMV